MGCLAGLAGLAALAFVGLILIAAANYKPSEHRGIYNVIADASPRPSPATDSRGAATSYLAIKKYTWEKGGFGTVGLIHVTIKNLSTHDSIANIHYKTAYYAESGVQHGSWGGHGVIEKVLGPGQIRTFEVNDGFINTQATKMSLQIAGADWQ